MEILTKPSIQNIADRFEDQYRLRRGGDWLKYSDGHSSEDTYKEILLASTLEEVNRILGNETWTTHRCSICYSRYETVLRVEEVCICKNCFEEALKLLGNSQGE